MRFSRWYDNYCLMECDAVWFGRQVSVKKKHAVLWWWRQQNPLKRPPTPATLQVTISTKTAAFNNVSRYSCTYTKACTNCPHIWKPHQTSKTQKSNMKFQIQYWQILGAVVKKCSRCGYLKTGVCAPLASVPYRIITFRFKWRLKTPRIITLSLLGREYIVSHFSRFTPGKMSPIFTRWEGSLTCPVWTPQHE